MSEATRMPSPTPVDSEKHTADMEKAQQSISDHEPEQSADVVTPEPIDDPQSAARVPDGGRDAWLVAAGTAGVLFCTMGYTNTFGVFQAFYMSYQLRDESPDRIAWIGSLQNFLIFATAAVSGPLFDRFGAVLIYPTSALYVLAIMLTSLCTRYWHFMLAQGILTGITDGFLMYSALPALTHYFDKKRGAAMGICLAGSSLGGVVFPIALGKMLQSSNLGFGTSIRISGFVMIPIPVFSCLTVKARLPPRRTKFFLPSAFRQSLYDILILSVWCLVLGMYLPLIFLPSFAIEQGMDTTLASYLLAMLNGASIFGRIIPGIAADKLGRLNVLVFMGAATGILILVWPRVSGTAGVIVYAVVYGFTSGAIVSGATVALSTCPIDAKDMGTWMGQGMALSATGILVGPPVSGAMLRHFGGFSQLSVFGGVLTLVGAGLTLAAKTQTKQGLLGKI